MIWGKGAILSYYLRTDLRSEGNISYRGEQGCSWSFYWNEPLGLNFGLDNMLCQHGFSYTEVFKVDYQPCARHFYDTCKSLADAHWCTSWQTIFTKTVSLVTKNM